MAFSRSIQRAQIPQPCQLCDIDTNIKWKCIQCNKYMCDKCTKIHLKVQISVQHEIVDIKLPEACQNVSTNVTTDNMPCEEHKTKMNCLFCQTCDKLVCPDCVSSSHKKHDFESIKQVLLEKVDLLKGIEEHICRDLSICKSKTEEIQSTKTKCDEIFDDAIIKIKQKEEKLTDAINKYSQELQKRIESERKRVNKVCSKVKQQIDKADHNLADKKDTVRTAVMSNQGKTIFAVATEFRKTMPDLYFNPLPPEIKQFNPGKETLEDVYNLFGSLHAIKMPQVQSHIDFEVVKTYITNLPYVDRLLTLDKKTVWISTFSTQVLQQVNIEDDNIRTIQEISTLIFNMTLTPENDILLCVGDPTPSGIKLLTKSGKIHSKPVLSVAPMLPRGIHVTRDNDTIVGVIEHGNLSRQMLLDKSQRSIITFGKDGKRKHSYEFDKDGQRLFTLPVRITTNINSDILVIDWFSNNQGKVVSLGKDGNSRWIYEGNTQINSKDKPFFPWDIVTTSFGQIIVDDVENHAFHILSMEGDLVSCKVVEDMGISFPKSLHIDKLGRLWVGCDSAGQNSGAKIHIVKLLY